MADIKGDADTILNHLPFKLIAISCCFVAFLGCKPFQTGCVFAVWQLLHVSTLAVRSYCHSPVFSTSFTLINLPTSYLVCNRAGKNSQ